MRLIKWILRLFVLAVVAAAGWLYFAPPDLIRVATAYSAKMVCSNVFLAGRDAQDVLTVDVQEQGHPILKYIKLNVDETEGTVRASLAGLFGESVALHRSGLGCTPVPDGNVAAAKEYKVEAVEPSYANVDQLWPIGNAVEPSQNPDVAAILDDAALQGPGMRAIIVAQNGRIVGERYGKGFDASTPLLGWSMTKTVTAALVGTLVRDGKLSLDKKGLFAQWTDGRKEIALADLMGMSSGLVFNEDYGDVTDVTRMLFLERDMAAFARDKALEADIGKKFNYSSGTSVLLAKLWQEAIGEGALAYPRKALFDPLNMASATMEADASGTFVGSSFTYANARDWARFAQMLLDGGIANGQQILPPDFVALMDTPSPASDTGYGPDYSLAQTWLKGPSGSGADGPDSDAGFALPKDTFWMRGYDGQSIAIIPSKKMVVLRMGITPSRLNYKSQGLVQRLVAVMP